MKLRDDIKANDLVLFASGGLVEWVLVLNVNLDRVGHGVQVRTQGGETFTTNVRRLVRAREADLSKARERLIRVTLKEK